MTKNLLLALLRRCFSAILARLFRGKGLPTLAVLLTALPALAVDLASSYQLDPTFTNSPHFHQQVWPGRVTSGPSGKVYVTYVNGDSLGGVNNQRRGEVLRLNADGSLDSSFNVGSQFSYAWPVIEQANDQVLVGAIDSNEYYDSGPLLYRIFRLHTNGTRDASYQSPTFTDIPRFMTLQPDGKLLLVVNNEGGLPNGGLVGLQRLNSDGSLDTGFVSPAIPDGSTFFANIVLDSANRILVGGAFASIAGQPRPGIARLLSNGTVDSTFVPSGFTLSGSAMVRGIGIQTQGANAGKIVIVGGNLRTSTGTQTTCPVVGNTTNSNCALLRLNADGSLDTGFTLVATRTTGVIPARGRLLGILPDDKVLAVDAGVAKFNADGSLDTTYNKPVFSAETFWMDTLADGRVYVPITGGSTVNGAAAPQQVMRFNADGTADAAFAPGTFQREIYPDGFAPFADGRFLTWGNFDTVGTIARRGAARFNADGTLDTRYAISGIDNLLGISNAEVLSDGRLVGSVTTGTEGTPLYAAGTTLVRLTATGARDSTYVPDSTIAAKASTLTLKVLPDGKALVWDTPTPASVFGSSPILFKRLNIDGSLDNTFVGLTGANGLFGAAFPDATNPAITVGAFRVLGNDAEGRLIAAATKGPYLQNATSFTYTLLRLNANGTLDSSFAAPSVTWTNTFQGYASGFSDGSQYLATYVSGSPFSGVLPQADGGLIVYGAFTTLGGQAAPGIARLTNSGALDPAFSVAVGAELRSLPGRSAQIKHVTKDVNGKYWVSGMFDTFSGAAAPGLTRLNADGTVDASFSSSVAYRSYLGTNTRVVFDAADRPVVLGSFLPSADGFPDAIHRLVLPGPTGLSVVSPATLQSSASTKLIATASYSVGASKLVNPNWTSSNPAAATVSPVGILTAASVNANTSVTITATYSENGTTVTASSVVTVTAVPAALSSLAIVGKSSVPAGAQVLLLASATYSDGSTRQVAAASWSVAPSNLGSVDSRGRFTAGSVPVDSDTTITANYTEGVITRSATFVVSISAAPSVLQGLTIIGAQGTLASGQSLPLSAFGDYADGSRKAAKTTTWEASGNAASISSGGVLTANAVTVDTQTVVTASYTEAGVSVRAQYLIVVQATAIVSPIAVEVESSGPQESSSLAVWSSLSLQAGAAAVRDAKTARPTYNMYVVALIPAGPLTGSPVIFLLNRSKQWQALGFPLAEYLSGISEGSFQLVSIFENLDASILSGTQIFVGYGTSDQEMLSTGRFKMVYQVQ